MPYAVEEKNRICRRRYKAEQRNRLRIYVRGHLATHPCIGCRETDFRCLDFDHRNPDEKYRSISQIIHGALGINVLIKEIAKCDVRCANCHRKKHYSETH